MANTTKQKRYFIVNPAGTIHEVNPEHMRVLLAKVGYRKATAAEVKKLEAAKGNQRWDAPICEPFSTEPEAIEIE